MESLITLSNRTILKDGTVINETTALREMLYNNISISGVYCREPLDQTEWESASIINDDPKLGPIYTNEEQYNGIPWFQHWVTPYPYNSIDIEDWCYNKCSTEFEIERVIQEMDEFKSRGMLPILRHLVYVVDTWRSNNIVWGVGRGSSVCSFVLYLIGINRINPLDFNLDISEWMR